jgi:hypothetical protein
MVFLSYARDDHFFAELAVIKLGEAKVVVWRDHGRLRAGEDWRQGIEQGIADSLAVLVALSPASSASAYVTYEWAYALGKGKPVIPLKLGECAVHPKLETVQYLDFSIPGAGPWESLVERIQEVEVDRDTTVRDTPAPPLAPADSTAGAILAYLNQRGYQMVSFERLRKRIDAALTDERLNHLVSENGHLFRTATVQGGRPGLAKVVP